MCYLLAIALESTFFLVISDYYNCPFQEFYIAFISIIFVLVLYLTGAEQQEDAAAVWTVGIVQYIQSIWIFFNRWRFQFRE